ncbi:Schwann cell myelin protein-like isoform X2 [Phyllobates terribilis]|uniref:Schwann cell myelin protein-like isoform X2 n=1 Tax=Phyllobates terribilis TaxID=111132 RepID=UPI003CCB4CC3
MDAMKQIYLLLICQGFYLGSVCQEWTFPSEVTALIGSCVEIPCIYHSSGRSGASSPVWYLSIFGPDAEILNTKDSSSVGIDYKDRTSLLPGNNSCSLRIDPVKREDGEKYYYPGIAEDRTMDADESNLQLGLSNHLTEGEATIIRCSVEHTCRSSPPSLQWSQAGEVHYQTVEISEESWREESNLTYIPSVMDDGTAIQCTATYPNGQSFHLSGTLNITGSSNLITNSYGHIIIPATIVTVCLALLLFACWRKKHKKLERTETEATYTDLIRTDFTDTYDQLKPVIPANSATKGYDVKANEIYENVQNQND